MTNGNPHLQNFSFLKESDAKAPLRFTRLKEGMNYTQIANNIGVSKSTISREIKRNSINGKYNPDEAEMLVFKRHKYKSKYIKLTKSVEKTIRKYLKKRWSPEQK